MLGGHRPAFTIIITSIYSQEWLLEIEGIAVAISGHTRSPGRTRGAVVAVFGDLIDEFILFPADVRRVAARRNELAHGTIDRRPVEPLEAGG